MALQESGQIRLNEIHVEAGGTSGTQTAMNDADNRGLIGAASGSQMKMTDWYGASAGPTWNFDWSTDYSSMTLSTWGTPNYPRWLEDEFGDVYSPWSDAHLNTFSRLDAEVSGNGSSNAAVNAVTYLGELDVGTYDLEFTLDNNTRANGTSYVIVRGYSAGFVNGSSTDYKFYSLNTGASPLNVSTSFTVTTFRRHVIVSVESHTTGSGFIFQTYFSNLLIQSRF